MLAYLSQTARSILSGEVDPGNTFRASSSAINPQDEEAVAVRSLQHF